MEKILGQTEQNFFEVVAHHNLERFHSECISWAFNLNNKEMLLNFIVKVAEVSNKDAIKKAVAYCEVASIDILVSYNVGDQHHFIHIENKVKATEHDIKLKNQVMSNDFKIGSIDIKNIELSQTEFYYYRDKIKIENELCVKNAKWQYLFLVPAVSDDQPKNNWGNQKIARDLKTGIKIYSALPKDKGNEPIPNPWETISYRDIIEIMPIESGNVIFNNYRNYLINHFLEKKEIKNKCQVNITNEGLSTKIIDKLLKPYKRGESASATILEEYSLRLHFEAVKEELNTYIRNKVKKEYRNYFRINFLTDTGNNGGYLLDVYFIATAYNCDSTIFNKKNVAFRIGLQFEQNKKGSGKFKYYFADVLYESGLIKKRDAAKRKYKEAVQGTKTTKGILRTIFSEDALRNCQRKKDNELKFNGSTSKSFCSYLEKYEFKNKKELVNNFILAIDSLVVSIQKNNFEKLLNEKFQVKKLNK